MLKLCIYVLIAFTLVILYFVNNLIPEPYMDEIFHFPQADKYFNGIFDYWDPKITTPPGLYLFTVAILKPLSMIANVNVADISYFRSINLIFSASTFYVTFWILQHLHKEGTGSVVFLSSLNITMFPVLYFFNFLYYTDCGSTFFVLLMYYWHLKKFHFSSAVAGAVSILFRQTNIVWVFYAAADETLQILLDSCKQELSKKEKKLCLSTLIFKTEDKNLSLTSVADFKKTVLPILLRNWRSILKKLIRVNIGYILVAIGFITFIIHNGSLALGDKTAHQACFHVPQLFYFLLFFLVFACPYLISIDKVRRYMSFASSDTILVFELTAICCVCILFMSHVHPYLLADNRHYPFYIWRRLLGRDVYWSLALTPVYIFSGWLLTNALQHESVVFKVLMTFCVCVSVIPQKLLEFRYFIIPFIMLRLHLKVASRWQPYLEFVLFSVVNFIVLYLFLFQMLPWENSEKEVRIMW